MVLVVGVQLNLVCKGLVLQPKVPSEVLGKLVDSVGALPVVLPQDKLDGIGGGENKAMMLVAIGNELLRRNSDNG